MPDATLPPGWVRVPLSELLVGIETGKSFKCDERPPAADEVGVVKVSAVSWGEYREEESKTCMDATRVNADLYIRPGDFLFSRANTIELVGACVIARQVHRRVMLSDKILRFKFVSEDMKGWVLQYLRSQAGRTQIEELASGNQESMRNIGQERVGQVLVPVPPTNERAKIIDKLDELLSELASGGDELANASRKLTQYRQSLLKAAVEGELTAEWRASNPPQETGAELLARILRERQTLGARSEPLVASIPTAQSIPVGWTWASMDQLAWRIQNGCSRTPSGGAEGLPVLRISSVRPLAVDLSEVRYLAGEVESVVDFLLEEGDLLATRYNGSVEYLGVVGVVRGLARPTAHPDKLIRIRPCMKGTLADWIEIAAAAGASRSHIVSRVKTTAGQTGIAGPDLKAMPIPLPPLQEQAECVRLVSEQLEAVAAQKAAIDRALQYAAAQRQNILRAAFSGQLVPQDPNDEPASALLARIRAQRAQTPSVATKARKPRAPNATPA